MENDLLNRFRARWEKFFNNIEAERQERERFMHDACDHWERLGNNAEPIQPEDCFEDEDPRQER